MCSDWKEKHLGRQDSTGWKVQVNTVFCPKTETFMIPKVNSECESKRRSAQAEISTPAEFSQKPIVRMWRTISVQ